jgi:FMN-dependent NADH-azoreductase
MTGLKSRFVVVEFTLADTKTAMAEPKPLAAQSLADGQAQIDLLWQAQEIAV